MSTLIIIIFIIIIIIILITLFLLLKTKKLKSINKKKYSNANYSCFLPNNVWNNQNIPICQSIFKNISIYNYQSNLNYLIDSENSILKDNIYLNSYQINKLLEEYISKNFLQVKKGYFNNQQSEFFMRILVASIIPKSRLIKFRPYYPQYYITRFPNVKTPYSEFLNPTISINQIIPIELTLLNRTNKILFLRNSIPNSNFCCLIFGSFTCPTWRKNSPEIISFCLTNNIKFLFIYTQEAFTSDGWQIPQNIDERITYSYPKTNLQRIFVANQAYNFILKQVRKQNPKIPKIQNFEFPMLIDKIDNKLDKIFEIGGPYRIYLLEGNNIIWRQGLHQSCLESLIGVINKRRKII